PYDYWAIEHAYKPIAPAWQKEELAKIAGRSGEPQLAFGNDIDAGFGGSAEGMDPQVNRRDLGSDPLDYATRRLKLSRELWTRLQDRRLNPGDSYELLRRNFLAGLTQLSNAGMVGAKYVGGVVYVRDHAGSGRDPFTPVPAAKQRAALKLIADGLLSVDSFRLRPEFVRRLTVDQFDRYRDDAGLSAITPDIVLTTRMLGVQRAMLDQLMSDSVATRIAEGEFRQTRDNQGFRLSELYDTLQDAVWSELKTQTVELELLPVDNRALANLCGALDANLRQVEAALDVTIARRGAALTLRGASPQVQQAATALQRFYAHATEPLSVDDIQLGL